MSQETTRTIAVRHFAVIQDEYEANAAVIPGYLVELMSTGKIRAHATAAGNANKWFVKEEEYAGNGIEDAYTAADMVQVLKTRTGDRVLAILAQGESVVIGDFLQSNGDGTLKKWVAEDQSFELDESSGTVIEVVQERPLSIVGMATEALDMSDSSGAESSDLITTARIIIEIV